ncbi:MAG: ATP-binding protein [Verrucomicrobiia bacterium]
MPSGELASSVWPARDGGMWMAAFGVGLLRQDETGTSSVSVPEQGGKSAYGLSVLEDRTGRVCYGEIDGCFWRKPQQGFELAPFKWRPRASLSALFEDSKGQVWIGSQEGAVVYGGNAFQRLGAESGLPQKAVVCFGEDASGHVWIAASAGLFRQEKERFHEVRDASDRALRGVLCFKADPDGTMWMGTRAGGLLRWRNGKMDRIGLEHGLPDLEVRGLIEDEHGHFWMPSNRGILRVSRQQLLAVAGGTASRLDYQLLDQNDGLLALECPVGQPTCARDAAGRLWFATQKGLARIDPAKFQLNSNPPPVQIEQLSFHAPSSTLAPGESQATVSRRSEIRFSAPFPKPLRLPPGSYGLEIEYAALSYSAPEKVRFQIKLATTSIDWEDVWSRRVVRFHQLTPGEHAFLVRAANGDGVWNETGASLAFTVQPYFWQTWWFRFGIACLLIGAGGAAAWWWSRSLVRGALERERTADEIRALAGRLINAQEDERRRIARELHDDFSQRLALLSVEMELLGAAKPGAEVRSAPRLEEMAARVKDLSTEVHRLAYELHPAKIEQLGLVAAARSFCRELSQHSSVRVEFEAHDFPRAAPADLALCFYRIIQESLQNVVRHSGATEARVELGAEADQVWLAITDSGRGFHMQREGRESGLGLSSMRERARLINGTLTLKSELGRGTRVEVRAPLAHKDPLG